MAKKLVSFRMDEDRIAELRELADVYTNGNATDLIETLIRRMYFLEPLALTGKYRTPGFGIAGQDRERIKSAWDTWINQNPGINKPETAQCNKKFVYTVNGEVQAFRRSEIRDLAKILKLPIDTNYVYTISIKKEKGSEGKTDKNKK